MWFIGVEVEQETSAPPPKKNPGSAPGEDDTKHTSKARKNPILVSDDLHRMRAKGTCLYPDVSYLAVFKLSVWINSKSPVSILSF